VTSTLRAISFADLDHGLAVGDGGVLLRSLDGGVSFDAPATPAAGELRAVRFSGEAGAGFAVGDAGLILATHDAGSSWQTLARAPADLSALSLSDDAARIVAVGSAGLVWRSVDGGASFEPGSSGVTAALATIGFSDEADGLGWAAGAHGTLRITHDGGASFRALASPTNLDLYAVEDL
ncbi:MAG: WD40/YVTN/BNR-like repeat-containing protein, partial [Polyangia bacterium]